MPIDYKYRSEENLIELRCYGELTIEEISNYFESVRFDGSIQSGSIEIVNLSEITYFNVDYSEVATMPSAYSPTHQEKHIKGTIQVGPTTINLGLAELIQAYFKQQMPSHPFFTVANHEEALIVVSKIREAEAKDRQRKATNS